MNTESNVSWEMTEDMSGIFSALWLAFRAIADTAKMLVRAMEASGPLAGKTFFPTRRAAGCLIGAS